jgi:hypothetical protein
MRQRGSARRGHSKHGNASCGPACSCQPPHSRWPAPRGGALAAWPQRGPALQHALLAQHLPAGSELASALSFMMQLGFMRVGQPYAFDGLSPLEQRIAAHMAQLGLLHTFVAVRAGQASTAGGQRCGSGAAHCNVHAQRSMAATDGPWSRHVTFVPCGP